MAVILTGVKWYLVVVWFAFAWWLEILSTFSWNHWPPICLFLKNIHSVPLPIFKSDWGFVFGFFFFFLPLNCMSSLYNLNIKPWSDTKVRVRVKVAQSCPSLCYPMDYTVHRILQARILEWVAISFSRGSSQPRDRTQVSHIAGGFFTSWATGEAWSDIWFVNIFSHSSGYLFIFQWFSLLSKTFPFLF